MVTFDNASSNREFVIVFILEISILAVLLLIAHGQSWDLASAAREGAIIAWLEREDLGLCIGKGVLEVCAIVSGQ